MSNLNNRACQILASIAATITSLTVTLLIAAPAAMAQSGGRSSSACDFQLRYVVLGVLMILAGFVGSMFLALLTHPQINLTLSMRWRLWIAGGSGSLILIGTVILASTSDGVSW